MHLISEIREKFTFYSSITEYELEHAHIFTSMFVNITKNIELSDAIMLWGLRDNYSEYLSLSQKMNKPLYFFEDGFIRSIFTAWADVDPALKSGISFTVDRKSSYFDANKETDLELLLNYCNLTDEQKHFSRKMIKKIIDNKLSKYNNQLLTCPNYGELDREKVLIVDQSYRDASITYGWADDNIFEKMVNDAIENNPNCDILVKVHPDTIAQKSKTKYFEQYDNNKIIFIYDEINPIVLFEQVNKIYVCTSQLGLEALLCDKDVYVYGMPFYAGWGLTYDFQKCSRRQRKRTIEEIFYIVYVLYSHYINPETGKVCSIEDAIDYLLNLRNLVFKD